MYISKSASQFLQVFKPKKPIKTTKNHKKPMKVQNLGTQVPFPENLTIYVM